MQPAISYMQNQNEVVYILRWIDAPWVFLLEKGTNRIGSNPTNDFRVTDPSVSSYHAVIQITDEGAFVKVLHGRANQTAVNGVEVAETAVIVPDMVLMLGKITFRFEADWQSSYRACLRQY